MFMLTKKLLRQILDNEALTRGLGDPEARILIEWLVDRAEEFAQEASSPEAINREIKRLCVRARSIGRFVDLWCHRREQGAAVQLAGTEGFSWPLPAADTTDPCEIIQTILTCETGQRVARASMTRSRL